VNPVLVFLLGLGAVVVGAEVVVREGSALATRFNVSPLVVGMTIVSLGTSLPESSFDAPAGPHPGRTLPAREEAVRHQDCGIVR
jgi:hypothetical protein